MKLSWSWLGKKGAQGGHAERADSDIPVRVSSHDWVRSRPLDAREHGYDRTLLAVITGLLLWGLVMVYSASVAMPDNPRFANYSQFHFVIRHLFALGVGLGLALLVFQISPENLQKAAPWLFVLATILLVAVLLPFIGRNVNGANRWISLGIMNFQPSELAKFAVVLYASDYMVRKMEVKESFFKAVLPMGVAVGIIGALLLAEPDMGAFMVIVVIAMGILFLGGVNVKVFAVLASLLVAAFAMIIVLSPWRRERIFAYLDPWDPQHTLDKGYQLSHSLIAVGNGELTGAGLGGSVEKLHWLPEAHTDFLMAVIGEEFGLVGVATAIALFFWMTRRIMHIGRQAISMDRLFAGMVAQGVGMWVGFQAFINIGVNLGALPTKGLTLPLMSYGGSAILMNLVALAVVMRIDVENRRMMRGGRP
ncbi:MAG: hypothetical protein RLZZ397_1320 [Pseudomonadota bacterium]